MTTTTDATGTRRVRHEVADGIRVMAFAPYAFRAWGYPQLGTSIVLAVAIAVGLGRL